MKKIFFLLILTLAFISSNAQDSTLQQYTGKYVFADGSPVPDVEVVLTGDALTMSSVQGNSTLVKLGIDSFQIVEFSGTAVFKHGDDQKVKSVHIEAMGYVLDGQKQSDGAWSFRRTYRPSRELYWTKK